MENQMTNQELLQKIAEVAPEEMCGVDESPHCYKRLHEVLAYHAGTIEIVNTLRPIGVAMAGANEYDPYKD